MYQVFTKGITSYFDRKSNTITPALLRGQMPQGRARPFGSPRPSPPPLAAGPGGRSGSGTGGDRLIE